MHMACAVEGVFEEATAPAEKNITGESTGEEITFLYRLTKGEAIAGATLCRGVPWDALPEHPQPHASISRVSVGSACELPRTQGAVQRPNENWCPPNHVMSSFRRLP